MDQQSNTNPTSHKVLRPRRLALLASAAGLSLAVLATGPGGYLPLWASSAHAAETSATNPGFGDLSPKSNPAVISVRVKIDGDAEAASVSRENERMDSDQSDSQSPFQQFERQFGRGQNGMMPQRHQVITGEGSGFFISADGYAVTNNHVVDHAQSVQVTTDDGTVYTAKVIGTDKKTDLALIKVDGKKDFSYVKFADAPPRVGDWVVAVGNPFGLGGTVTAGIVSARGRDIGAGPYDDYVQIDAPVNKGNSGGPTFDMDGNVIGVNTAIFSPSGGSVGIAFDIPAETVKTVVAQLKDKGFVRRGWIGVQIQSVTSEIAEGLGLKGTEGALVAEPQADSPAAKAGVVAGDVITALNGHPVKDAHDLAKQIGLMNPGTTAKLSIWRKGEEMSFSLTLGELPKSREARATSDSDAKSADLPKLGMTVAPAGEVAGSGSEGIVVTEVDPDGLASERGLKSGDVILEVGGSK